MQAEPASARTTASPSRRFELCLLGLTAASLAASVILGGASARDGYTTTAGAQLACLPALGVALWAILRSPLSAEARTPLAILATGWLLPLVYLTPLPPAVWTILPGRAQFAEAYLAVGAPTPWLPLSLDPNATLGSAVSLAPGAAVFLATLRLGWGSRRRLIGVLLLLAAANTLLGLAQLTVDGGALRPYTITNDSSAVGFFANRNHSIALALALLPLVGATAQAVDVRSSRRRLVLASCGLIFLLLLLGLGLGGSRAGLVLGAPAAIGCVLVAAFGWRRLGRSAALAAAGGLVVVLLVAVAAFAHLTGAAGPEGLRDPERAELARVTLEAAPNFQPFGSGFGTFTAVYQDFEDPESLRYPVANHAHNEFLELWLEGGWPFAAVCAAFGVWLVGACARLLKAGAPRSIRAIQAAGALTILLLLTHSLVDYPLRTSAMMAVFGLGCGLLVQPPGLMRRAGREAERPG